LFLDGNNAADIQAWGELVDSAPIPDVYYRPGYVRAYAMDGGGRPAAVVISNESTRALFPLLIRDLEIDGQVLRDAISPYGYGGLLHLSGPTHPAPRVALDLLGQLRDWARSSNLVACTLRFHPLLDQGAAWGISEISEEWTHFFSRGQTTAIQLEGRNDFQRGFSGMTKGRRYDLKRARSALEVRISEGPSVGRDMETFRNLYRKSMQHIHADEFFLFSDEYFDCLASELGDKLAIVSALIGDRNVASAIFLLDRTFAHYHLAASTDEGKEHGAATLLVIAASEWARRKGCSLLHLGGGLRSDDRLWAFKRSFGGGVFRYSYATLVADSEKYMFLMHQARAPWPYIGVSERPETKENVAGCDATLDA
jgi:hypothetical protein